MSEIVICPYCFYEYDLYYSLREEEEIVSQTRCLCPRKSDKQKLDWAINEVAKKFNIKLTGVSNEKYQSGSRKVSR